MATDAPDAVLEPLFARDRVRAELMGDRRVTLGELVDGVLDGSAHDLLDVLDVEPLLVPRMRPRPPTPEPSSGGSMRMGCPRP